MDVSIIVSVYNEEEVLELFYEKLLAILTQETFTFEVIFVNDGSTDKSQQLIDQFTSHNQHIKSILFSRNFGHEAAMIAGIDNSKGNAVICMDSDLQHPPAMIPAMMKLHKETEADVINMIRDEDKLTPSPLFYKFLNLLSPQKLETNASDFFLISKRIAEILRVNYRERVRFLRGFIQIMGFKKTSLVYESVDRIAGKSKYSYRKLFSLSIVAISSLSKIPLKVGIYIGFISGIFSILLAIYSIIMKIVDQPVSGYTTIIVFLGIMFSIQFIIIGIIGEYIGFLFDEQKQRPIYLIDRTTNMKKEE